nr:hypothetical protein Q903MT_gene931 [Picea sitchensis]
MLLWNMDSYAYKICDNIWLQLGRGDSILSHTRTPTSLEDEDHRNWLKDGRISRSKAEQSQ